MTWDTVYKIFSLIVGTGIFGGLIQLVVWAIRLEPRVQSIESSIRRIEVGLSDFRYSQWDGTERRRDNV